MGIFSNDNSDQTNRKKMKLSFYRSRGGQLNFVGSRFRRTPL